MIKKLVSYLGEYKAASIKPPLFAALDAIMDVLLPTIMAFIIDQGIATGDMNAIISYGLLTFLVAAIALVLGVLAGKYAACLLYTSTIGEKLPAGFQRSEFQYEHGFVDKVVPRTEMRETLAQLLRLHA